MLTAKVDKQTTMVRQGYRLKVLSTPISRGGLKLEKALRQFSIQARSCGWILNSSTGGFTLFIAARAKSLFHRCGLRAIG